MPFVLGGGGHAREGEATSVLSADGSTQLAPATVHTGLAGLLGAMLAANYAVGEDGESVPIQDGSGTSLGNATFRIATNGFNHIDWPGGSSGTPLENNDPVNVDTADGDTIMFTGTARVSSGTLLGVLAPVTVAVVNNGGTATITAADGTTADATIAVAANAASYSLPGNTALGINGTLYALKNDTGSARGQVSAAVTAGVLSLALPRKTDIAVDQQSYKVMSADGSRDLASALADVPESVFHGLLLPADHAVTPDGASVSLQDSGGNALDDGTGGVADNNLVITVPDSITQGGGSGPSQGDQVGVWNAANNNRMFIGTADLSTGPLKILAPSDVAALYNSGEVTLKNSAGDPRGTLDVSVGGNIGQLSLKAQEDTVKDADRVKLRYNNGDDTGEDLVVKVPDASLDSVQIDQAFTIVAALQWVNVVNSSNTQTHQALADLTTDGRLKNVGLGAHVTMIENQQQITCTLDGVEKQLTFSVSDGELTAVASADPA